LCSRIPSLLGLKPAHVCAACRSLVSVFSLSIVRSCVRACVRACMRACVRVRVRVCVRACVCVCVCVNQPHAALRPFSLFSYQSLLLGFSLLSSLFSLFSYQSLLFIVWQRHMRVGATPAHLPPVRWQQNSMPWELMLALLGWVILRCCLAQTFGERLTCPLHLLCCAKM
jgi:hypothetical protein